MASGTDSDGFVTRVHRGLRDRPLGEQIRDLFSSNEGHSNLLGVAFLTPNLLAFGLFMLLPVLFAIYVSFTNWNILAMDATWVGLENYKEAATPLPWENNWAALRDPTVNTWWFALKNTIVYVIATVPMAIYGGLTAALLLDTRIRGKKAFRAIYFLPGAVGAVVWRWHFAVNGLINQLLRPFGLDHNWAGDPATALFSIIVIGVWIGIGFNMILFLAGLQNIPDELYDAARIDGATQWHRFREVTWPNLANTTFFVIIISMIGSFQVFGIAYVFSQGGPYYATTTAVVRIYQLAFENGQMGLASAMSIMLFAILFMFSYYQYHHRQSEEVEY